MSYDEMKKNYSRDYDLSNPATKRCTMRKDWENYSSQPKTQNRLSELAQSKF